MYWEKEIETMDRGSLEKLQLARLGETLARAKHSVYYGKRFAEQGLDLKGMRTLADVERLALTTKNDLREQWPYGFLTCSRDEIVRMHSSSGTTGRATVIFHTMRHGPISWPVPCS
jgi:phenylacetate-CoA ligase